MAYSSATRSKVRASYIQIGVLTSAAALHKVPYATARTWKRQDAAKGNDWDIQRNARQLSRGGLEEMANQVLGELAEQFTTTLGMLKVDASLAKPSITIAVRSQILVQLMDGYNKAIAASTRALPNANRLAVAMDVIRCLTGLFAERYPKLRQGFVDAVEQLGDELVREFGAQR